MNRVFISYSRRNKTFAERLARDLSDAGLDVWIDFRQIHGGEKWQEEIFRGIERAEFLILLLSPAAVASEWVNIEVTKARELNKLVIPIMVNNVLADLESSMAMRWLLDVQFIDFTDSYEQSFPDLLNALPGVRPPTAFDEYDPATIPNPFKGLEAFQQTDSRFFFGREDLIRKSLQRMHKTRFLAVVGASGSGKSSLVRAGIIPQVRAGKLPGSENWPIVMFTPGANPVDTFARRMLPLLPGASEDDTALSSTRRTLEQSENINLLIDTILLSAPPAARLLIVIDQFEEAFTLGNPADTEHFLDLVRTAATTENTRAQFVITMRADFFGHLSRFPAFAELFEQENLVIATEMTAANLLRSIEGPAHAVGLKYEEGLVDRILEDVQSQPGSLPLLQYALRQLFEKRQGNRLTRTAYEEIGGVRRALAQHAENVYDQLSPEQQDIMRRILLRLVEVSEDGEATRRRVPRKEITFRGVNDNAVERVINLLTGGESRLIIASREIQTSSEKATEPLVFLEVSHEALIREWDRFKTWVAANLENLQYNSELLKAARDWAAGNKDSAYLLRGRRLSRAEIWLETADANELQREFIEISLGERASREEEERRRAEHELALERRARTRLRIIAVVLVIFLVVAVVLTGFALFNLDIANRNSAEARSLALAASARQALSDNDPDLAVVLAVEANQIGDPPPQTRRALADVAYAPGTRLVVTPVNGRITTLTYSPTNDYILYGTQEGTIVKIDAVSGTELALLNGHTRAVNSIAITANGRRAISASSDNTLILWDMEAGQIVHRLSGSQSNVRNVDINAAGTLAVSTSADNALVVWDLQSYTAQYELVSVDDERTLGDAIFTLGGDTIISALDERLILWDALAGSAISQLTPTALPTTAQSLAINSDGTLIAGGAGDSLLLWDAQSGTERLRISSLGSTIAGVAFSADGLKVAAGLDDGTLRLWEISTGQPALTFETDGKVTGISASVESPQIAGIISNNRIRIWETSSSDLIKRLNGHNDAAGGVAFHPNGRFVLTGSRDDTARLWDISTGYTLHTLTGHIDNVNDVAISADGTTALTASSDRTLILWNLGTGRQMRSFRGHSASVLAGALSPDGATAISGDISGVLLKWRLRDGYSEPFATYDRSVLNLAYNADGSQIVSSAQDGMIIIWDAATGEEIRRLEGHDGAVWSIAFNDEGTRLLSGGADETVRLWDLETGETIQRFLGHENIVTGVAFTADPDTVLSASYDGQIRLWDVQSGLETRRYTATRITGQITEIWDVALNTDKSMAVSGSKNGVVQIWHVLPTVDELLSWTVANRFIRPLSCDERGVFNILPLCQEEGILPTSTPLAIDPMPSLSFEGARVAADTDAIINSATGEGVEMRAVPNGAVEVSATVPDNTQVHVLDGPLRTNRAIWWWIQLPDGQTGWIIEAVNGVQTLLPANN